jgi:AcrR family transcriptional regulator
MTTPHADTIEQNFSEDQRSALQRQLILDCARAIFIDRGYAGGSMESIANLAGVSPSAIYRLIGNKDALFETMVMGEARQIAKRLPFLDPRGPDPHASLKHLGAALILEFGYPDVIALLRRIIGSLDRFPDLSNQFFRKSLGQARFQIAAYYDLMKQDDIDSFVLAERFTAQCLAPSMMQLFSFPPPAKGSVIG